MTRINTGRILPLGAAMLLAACSGDGKGVAAATGGPAQGDACGLLTREAISAQIGKTVGEGRKTNESGGEKSKSHMTTCTWSTPASAEGVSAAQMMREQVSVSVILWSWPNAQRGVHYLESFRKVAKEIGQPEPTVVPLGDEAIRDGVTVHVRKGNASFSVAVHVLGDADQQAAGKAAEALAGQVVAKL